MSRPPRRAATAAMVAALLGTALGGAAVYMGLTHRVGGGPDAEGDPSAAGTAGLAGDGDGPSSGAPAGDGDAGPAAAGSEAVAAPRPSGVEAPGASIETGKAGSLVDAVAITRNTVVTLKVGDTLNGAGVVFDAEGYVFTNFHVVAPLLRTAALSPREDAGVVVARFADGRELPARIVAADASEDIAILHLMPADSAERFPAAALGASGELRVGEAVFAVGSPVGLEHTVSTGIVSALDRTGIVANRQLGLIQLDASINVGNSGGPLFNLRGELVGITTARASVAQGIGFAIPIDRIRIFLDALRSGVWRRAGVVGLQMDPARPIDDLLAGTDYTTGVYVDVVPEGPAKRAGVAPGDVVVAVRGRRFDEAGTDVLARREIGRRLVDRVRGSLPGEQVPITVVRDGEARELQIEVEAASDRRQVIIEAERLLGLRLAESPPQGAGPRPTGEVPGVLVVGVVPETPVGRLPGAERLRGLRLSSIAGIAVRDLDDLGGLLPDLAALSRSGRQRQIAVGFTTPSGEQLTVPGFPLAGG